MRVKKVLDVLKNWSPALMLATGFVAFQFLITAIDIAQVPNGTVWLGAHAVNTSDMAVYLGYLAQGETTFLISNLFNDHIQIPRFDAFWSFGGLLVRAGLTPVIAHEFLRLVCTVILAFSVYAAARSLTNNKTDARRATFFLAIGMATGWMNGIWLNILLAPDLARAMSPDLETEFGLLPMLLGGAHMILSLALQIVFARWAWDGIQNQKTKQTALACAAIAYLTAFHPYFISWAGLFAIGAAVWKLDRQNIWPRTKHFLAVCLSMLPSAVYYIYVLLNDSSFREHHTLANKLPLLHPLVWATALIPISIATASIWLKKVDLNRVKNLSWAWAWLASALVCMALPFPWTAKYTQGLLLVATALTLPVWLATADWTARRVFWMRWMLIAACLISAFYLVIQEMTANASEKWNGNFYQYATTIQALDYLGKHTDSNAMVLAPSTLIDLWTPAYAARHAWIGHPHETPDYQNRLAEFKDWAASKDGASFLNFLEAHHITHVLLPVDPKSDYSKFFDLTWRKIFDADGAQIWERLP